MENRLKKESQSKGKYDLHFLGQGLTLQIKPVRKEQLSGAYTQILQVTLWVKMEQYSEGEG